MSDHAAAAVEEFDSFLRRLESRDIHLCLPSPGMDPISETREQLLATYFGTKKMTTMNISRLATMNISRLDEFGSFDRERAILCFVWEARECLGDAERKEETSLARRAHWCAEATKMLESVHSMVQRESSGDAHPPAGLLLLARAISASKAAVNNGAIAVSYSESAALATAPDWDKQRAPKAISIFKRAAETARQETHRALADLCDLFPDAVAED